jgi:hypothetical protein
MGEAAAGAPGQVPSQDAPAPFIKTARDPTDAERKEIMSILTAKPSIQAYQPIQPIGVRMYDWMKKNPGVRFDGVVTPTWRRDGYTFGGLNAIMMHVGDIEYEELAYADPRDRRFLKEALTLMPDPRRKNGNGHTATKILQDSVARMREIRRSTLPYAEKDLKMLLNYEKKYPLLISGLPDAYALAASSKTGLPQPNRDVEGQVASFFTGKTGSVGAQLSQVNVDAGRPGVKGARRKHRKTRRNRKTKRATRKTKRFY